jgi:hypothetical protein
VKPEAWEILKSMIETEIDNVAKVQKTKGLEERDFTGLHELISVALSLTSVEHNLKDLSGKF